MNNNYNGAGSVNGTEPERPNKYAKTREETDKKCPQCSGVMDFDPASGGLLCPYCGYTAQIDKKEEAKAAEEIDFLSASETGSCDWGVATKTIICKSCGAKSIYDVMQTSGECPYCGSNQVMETNDENTLAPGGVVPFCIDQKTASGKFSHWIKGKLFCPGKAKSSARPERFSGIYLPYWTFDAQTYTEYTARYGIDRTVRVNGKDTVRTDWSRTSGTHDEFINDQLVIATSQHDSKYLRQIEPFDTEANVKYKPEYIAGFVSERYSVGLKDAWGRAKDFIRARLDSVIENKILGRFHADRVDDLNMNTRYSEVKYKYLMLPVWISSFQYNGKIYQFMVNGQTGKVGGKTPVSPWKVLIAILIALAAIGILYAIFESGGGDAESVFYEYY